MEGVLWSDTSYSSRVKHHTYESYDGRNYSNHTGTHAKPARPFDTGHLCCGIDKSRNLACQSGAIRSVNTISRSEVGTLQSDDMPPILSFPVFREEGEPDFSDRRI